MPDINYTITGQISKGALSQSFGASGITADIATSGLLSVTLNLGTSVTQISTANMGVLGLAFARSLATETTHTVSFGRYVGGALHETARLKAGEAAVLRLAAGDYAAKAAVEGSRLVFTVYED
jgi:hypothetical protein